MGYDRKTERSVATVELTDAAEGILRRVIAGVKSTDDCLGEYPLDFDFFLEPIDEGGP